MSIVFSPKESPEVYLPLTSIEYQPVITAEKKHLLCCIPLESYQYGWLTICLDVFSLLTLFLSLFTLSELTTFETYLIYYAWLYIIMFYIILPCYQNLEIVKKNCDETSSPTITDHSIESEVSLNYGCITCMILYTITQLIIGNYEIRWTSEENTVENVLNEIECNSHYIPFSIYNSYFQITHPTKELNTALNPNNHYFGVVRNYLFVISFTIKANFNLYLFVNVLIKFALSSDESTLAQYFALISLLCSLNNLIIYLLSVTLGIILYPYTILMILNLVFFDICKVGNPRKGTLLYGILSFYWKILSKFE